MAVNLRVKIPGAADIERLFSTWFWLIVLVLWLGILGWLGMFARQTLTQEEVNQQLLTSKEVRLDQKTFTTLTTLFDARIKQSDVTGVSPTRF